MSHQRRSFEPDPAGEWILIIGFVLFALGLSVAPFLGMWLGLERVAPRAPDAGEVSR